MKTIQEVATMFGVSRTAVHKWIKDGLPYRKEKIIGHNVRFIIDPADVYAYHKAKENIVKKGE